MDQFGCMQWVLDTFHTQSKFYKNELQKTLDELRGKMFYSGCFGDERTIQKIILLLSEMWVKSEQAKAKQESSNTIHGGYGKNKTKDKREFLAYKYSNRKKGDLHEAVIL